MNNTEISLPVAKAASAIAAAVTSNTNAPEQIARAVVRDATYDTWMSVMSIPWGTVASIAAVIYTTLLISEWFWKKLWRPLAERFGVVKPRKRYILTPEEFAREQEKGEL